MEIDFHYGKAFVTLQIPDKNIAEVIRPWRGGQQADNITLLNQSLECKQRDDFHKNIAGKRLCVLLDDGTRDMPLADVFGQLLPVLDNASLVRFIICTGTHDAETAENITIKQQIDKFAAKAGISDYQIHVHNYHQDSLINAGRTSYGTEVLFNAKADDAQIFLVLSDVKCHYFAGYCNPVKNFVPGICAYSTTEQNHSLALDEKSTFGLHPFHSDKARCANPIAADQLEAMRLIVKDRPVYTLVTISNSGRIWWTRFGLAEKVSKAAFDVVDRMNSHAVDSVDHMVVSPGGFPNDIDLYIAQRALELTKSAVKDGGEVLFLSACPNGIGAELTMENFYNRLTAPIDQVLQSIKSQYKLFSHKPYKFAQMIKRLRRIWIYSQIPDNLIQAAHLHPVQKPQEVVDGWIAEKPTAKIIAVDGANQIALYPRA
ncbi:MAG: DUF2088 domain-containing protein [Planctomycetota bacterium]|nr:MAG: DUF2088 domain-containing protein [Planctomycetota bacterium]